MKRVISIRLTRISTPKIDTKGDKHNSYSRNNARPRVRTQKREFWKLSDETQRSCSFVKLQTLKIILIRVVLPNDRSDLRFCRYCEWNPKFRMACSRTHLSCTSVSTPLDVLLKLKLIITIYPLKIIKVLSYKHESNWQISVDCSML